MAKDIYTIDSKAGYAMLDRLDNGESSVKTDNGWTWTKNKDGSYTATNKDGVSMATEVVGRTTTPTSVNTGSSGGGSSNTGSSGGTKPSSTTELKTHTVDTADGYALLDKLDNGAASVSTPNGWTYTKNDDGSYYATRNGVTELIATTNRPQKQQFDLEAMLEALNAQNADWEERQRQSEEATRQLIESFYTNNEERLRQENQYATEKAIREIENSIANSNQSYSQLIAQNAIDAARAADNLAYRNAAAGNLGGIGGALYSQQQAGYDAQLGDIKNQQIALRQQADQQIAALEAQGEYELAAQISDVYTKKLESLMQLEDNILANYENRTQTMQSYYYKEMETAWDQAKTRLQLGVLGPSDFAILGISEDDANDLADYFSNLAEIDLAKAQTELDNLMIAGQQAQAKLAGLSGGGSSGGGYSSGGGGSTGGTIVPGDDTGNIYSKLLSAGITDSGLAYDYLLSAGYKSTDAKKIADDFASWYTTMSGTDTPAWDFINLMAEQGIKDFDNAYLYLKYTAKLSDDDAYDFAQKYVDALGAAKADGASDADALDTLSTARGVSYLSPNNPGPGAGGPGGSDTYIPRGDVVTTKTPSIKNFDDIPLANKHSSNRLALDNDETTWLSVDQLYAGLANGTIRSSLTPDGKYIFYNSKSPYWQMSDPAISENTKEYNPTVFPYSSITALDIAFEDGEIGVNEYLYWRNKMYDMGDTSGKQISDFIQTTPDNRTNPGTHMNEGAGVYVPQYPTAPTIKNNIYNDDVTKKLYEGVL